MEGIKVTISQSIGGAGHNVSGAVKEAISKIKAAGGGELIFEKGEYHFYEKDTVKKFFAVSNNSACDKNTVALIEGINGLTVDGNGSVFVFHELAFPFIVSQSSNIEIKNIIFDRGRYPQAIMKFSDMTDDGFKLEIDKNKDPYYVKDGALVFKRDWGEYSGLDSIFSIHATERQSVEYLITGDCRESHDNLPANYVMTDAEETDGGVYFKYRTDKKYKFNFKDGENVTSILDGRRYIDVIFIEKSSNIKISDIKVRRGVGMGIVAQLSRNIEIDNFSTDSKFYGEYSTLTADALHFVHCSGKLDIHNCTIEYTSDDAINMHGMYTVIEKTEENAIYSRIMHQEQRKFLLYESGDRLEIIDNNTFERVSEFIVSNAEFIDDEGVCIKISGHFTKNAERANVGFLIEIPDKMPDLHLYDNNFNNFPHMRLSGAGNILVENNKLTRCCAALLAKDLAKYWYESGRIGNLIFRNNYLDDCNKRGGENFILIDVDGVAADKCPKIHKRIEISGNTFKNIKKRAIFAAGVQELVIENNTFENITDELIVIDGKVSEE